jgi:hypothetical protein
VNFYLRCGLRDRDLSNTQITEENVQLGDASGGQHHLHHHYHRINIINTTKETQQRTSDVLSVRAHVADWWATYRDVLQTDEESTVTQVSLPEIHETRNKNNNNQHHHNNKVTHAPCDGFALLVQPGRHESNLIWVNWLEKPFQVLPIQQGQNDP